MRVLNLFSGIEVGMLALLRAGIPFDSYCSSEIDPSALRVSVNQFSNILRLGDVRRVSTECDLLMAGSPCQGFSRSGLGLGLKDARSALFFEFLRVLEEAKPTYWMLENVVMKPCDVACVSGYLGRSPILYDASLVSWQSRPRLFWTNWDAVPIVSRAGDCPVSLGWFGAMRGRSDGRQYIETRADGLSNCLTTVAKDNLIVSSYLSHRVLVANAPPFRLMTASEYEALQGLPPNYTGGCYLAEDVRRGLIGNSWQVQVVSNILSQLP